MGNLENVLESLPEAEKNAATPGSITAWIVLLVAYIGGLVSGFVFLVVPPLMPSIITRYNIDLGSAGLTMAVFSFVGLLLSLPAGAVLQKYGIKTVGIIAMLCCVAGCVMGALATNYTVFLLSRGVQGIGFTFIAMVGMTTAGIWFPPKMVGMAMGLCGTCVAVGGFAAMATAPRIEQSFGAQGVWWISAAMSAVSLVLVALFMRMPPWIIAAGKAAKDAPKPSSGEGYANRNIWLLSLAFCCFYLPGGALMTFYITFLNKVRGFGLEKAGLMNSLIMIGLLVGSPLGGYLIGKFGHLKLCLYAGALALGVLVCTGFSVTGIWIPIWLFLLGAVAMGSLQVVCMTAIPGIMVKPELIGVGFGIYLLGANLSGIFGPPYLGAVVQRYGWVISGYALIPVILVGIIAAMFTKFAD